MGKSIDEIISIISAVDHAFEMYISEFDGCHDFKTEEVEQERKEAIELIKSQQAEIERLKEQGKRKFLVKENGEIIPLSNVVRCKDCEWRGNKKKCILAFVADKQEFPLFFYDQRGEWYCADGVAKDINVPDKDGDME